MCTAPCSRWSYLGLAVSVAFAVVTALAVPANAAFPGPNGRIVFTSYRDGNGEIYSMNPDGSNLVRLTNDPAADSQPTFSPNGETIAFVSNRTGSDEIYIMNADGSSQTRLTYFGDISEQHNHAISPSFSPDGLKLVFTAYSNTLNPKVEVFEIAPDGSGLRQLTRSGLDMGFPVFSPDGLSILVTVHRPGDPYSNLYVMKADGSSLTQLTHYTTACFSYPDFSPDGGKVVVVGPSCSEPMISVFNSDGTGGTLVGSGGSDPAYSPDGSKIAFRDAGSLFVMDAVGSNVTQLKAGPGANFDPSWGRPDTTPPTVSCAPADSQWHAANVSIQCAASDGSGLANRAQASFTLATSVPDGTETANAATSSLQVCDSLGNCTTAGPITGNMIDRKPPGVSCDAPDGQWHSSDVAVPCTASDRGSGLANSGLASFTLATSVPDGTETTNAATSSLQVCDSVGNCTTAGPVTGNMIDRKPPTVRFTTPADGASYRLFSEVHADYDCTDGGSGLASCFGSEPNGAQIPTGPHALGKQTFTVTATDKVGNLTTITHTYRVEPPPTAPREPRSATPPDAGR